MAQVDLTAPLFGHPKGLNLVSYFCVPAVQTWGSVHDQEFKETVRQTSGINIETGQGYAWFVFVIRCRVAGSRAKRAKQIPDIDNVPKLIVDAFTGLLYPDDNLLYVRGVQVEGVIGADELNATEVWIFGMPAQQNGEKHAP